MQKVHHIVCCFVITVITLGSCIAKKNKTPAQASSGGTSSGDDLKFKAMFYDACREKIKGNIDIAQNLLKQCLRENPNSAPVNYELASLYRYSGRYEDALVCAKKAAQQDDKNEWYNLLYIECLHNKHLYNEAAARYESMLSKNPYRADLYEGLAGEYIYAGKPDKAIQTYNRLLKVIGPNEDISLQKVKLYKQQKKWKEAENELKDLIKNNPQEARYALDLGDLYLSQNMPAKALQTYEEALKADSANPYVHLTLSDYYRQQRNDSGFFKELKIAFQSENLDIDNKVKIVMTYYSITEQNPSYLPQAYQLCRSLVRQYPDNPKSHSVYADFLYRDNKIKEASEQYRKTIQLDDSRYIVWEQLLRCELDINANDSVVKHSAQVIELFPTQPIPYLFSAIGYIRLKQYSQAVTPLKEGKQFVYTNTALLVDFCSNLAETYNTLKEYEKSDKEFDEALQLDPDNASILNNYAYYLSLRKENLEKAEKLSQHSLEISSNNVSYIDTYGWILYKEGKYEEAKKYLQKAFDRGGFNRPAIVEHLGDVFYKLNETDKALDYWKKAKELGATSNELNKKIADKKLTE